jgi:hypothetical protein
LTIANTGGGVELTIAEAGQHPPACRRVSREQPPQARQAFLGDAGFSGSSPTAGQVVTPERPRRPPTW